MRSRTSRKPQPVHTIQRLPEKVRYARRIHRGQFIAGIHFPTAAARDPIYLFRRIFSIPFLIRTMRNCRVTIMLAVLACPSPLIAKSMDELVLECTEYRKLETKRVSIGLDHYLIAS